MEMSRYPSIGVKWCQEVRNIIMNWCVTGKLISGVRRRQSVLKEVREKSDLLIMAYIEWEYGLIKENLMMAF